MTDPDTPLAYLRDPRLAAHATAALPVWLWSVDASRVPWSNAIAAAIFGASTPAVLARRRFDPGQPTAAQIATLAERLAQDAPPRKERLRGLGAGVGRTLGCACSRITLADGTAGILIAATERAGPDLPLVERVRRMLAEVEAPLAVFTPEGILLHATRAVTRLLQGATRLADIGAVTEAEGHGRIETRIGPAALTRLGAADHAVLLLDLAPAPEAEPAAQNETRAPAEPPVMAAAEVAAPTEAPALAADAPPPQAEAQPAPAAGDAQQPEAAEPSSKPEPAADAAPQQAAETARAEPEASAPGAESVAPAGNEPTAAVARRHPLRFVWQIDEEGRFTVDSEEFVALVGPGTAAAMGRPWGEVAAALGLDPDNRVSDALATRDTWSGVIVRWPVDGTDDRMAVELSGLPIFDRGRGFRGYRGFGVCRDLAQIARLEALRRCAAAARTEADDVAATEAAPTPAEAPAEPPREERPVLALVSAAKNVVPFRPPHPESRAPTLSPVERKAFRELARQLNARLKSPPQELDDADDFDALQPGLPVAGREEVPSARNLEREDSERGDAARAPEAEAPTPAAEADEEPVERPILDRLPIGVLVYEGERLRYANRAFLDWAGQPDLHALQEAGGLKTLELTPETEAGEETGDARLVSVTSGDRPPRKARTFPVRWDGDEAQALMFEPVVDEERQRSLELALKLAQGDVNELKSILDTATDGVLVIDAGGTVLSANRSAEALFGYEAHEFAGKRFAELFAPESERAALDYLDGLTRSGVASVLNDGREVIGRVRGGGLIPLFMTMGRIADGTEKLCAVLRDMTSWKRAEEELVNARRQAEKASSAKSDFLAKISHEIRTPLNAIIGFSEVMMEERFGPVGNERYRDYLKDIHASGQHLVSLINDLLDLSKIEAGKLELNFTSVNLNDLTQQCVAIMQPQANRERIIIRSSLPPQLPQVVADARSLRQIVLNLLSNSIKYTGPGGQVIVSTALTDAGEVVLRVRDTGVGMSEQDIAAALEPFRQLATSARLGSGGTGLGLPLTKALAEANRATFSIKSAPNAGTLVEIAFPVTRVLAE